MANFNMIQFFSNDKADEAVAREIVHAIKASDEHMVEKAEFHCSRLATDVCSEPPAPPDVPGIHNDSAADPG